MSAVGIEFKILTLVYRANDFLRSNRRWKIVTCESIEFKTRRDKIDPNKMTYLQYGRGTTSYIRGLRLWLTERKDESEKEQKIGYFNLIPERLQKGGTFQAEKFETLDTVIQRFNSTLQFNSLPGRIITIESQKMKAHKMQKFDPDRSNWYEYGESAIRYVFVIRIFYEVMDGISEEIGKKNEVDTQIMGEYERGSIDRYYVRILRIAYTKLLGNPYSISKSLLPITKLTCRIFQPLQVTSWEYEDLVAMRKKVSAWVKATGACVLSAETTAYRMSENKGSESSSTLIHRDASQTWMFGIRLYLNGLYQEPPPEMLPALPEGNCDEAMCCQVS